MFVVERASRGVGSTSKFGVFKERTKIKSGKDWKMQRYYVMGTVF